MASYPTDDGPISDEYFAFLTEYAKQFAPKGKLIKVASIFDNIDEKVRPYESGSQQLENISS